jgi:hypothetical protein
MLKNTEIISSNHPRFICLINADLVFDNLSKQIRREEGVMTYLLFLYTSKSSLNIVISHVAYCKYNHKNDPKNMSVKTTFYETVITNSNLYYLFG